MPRDVMPVFGRTPYKGPGKRGFTPPSTTPSTTPFTRRKGGRPTSRITAPPPTTVPVIPTPTISQQGKGIISSVDKGRTNRENRRRDRGTGTTKESTTVDVDLGGDEQGTPSVTESRSNQPRGDWWWNRSKNEWDNRQVEETVRTMAPGEEAFNQWLNQEFSGVMSDMPNYWNRGQAQYGAHDPSRYHQLLPRLGDTATGGESGDKLSDLMSEGVGAFYIPFGASPEHEDYSTAQTYSQGMHVPEGGMKAGHMYSMPAMAAGMWGPLSEGVKAQDVMRHETVHDVHLRTDALLDDVRNKVQSGEASAHARHPWGEVEKTILEFFPEDLNNDIKGINANLGKTGNRTEYGEKWDLEELLTRVEDSKSGNPEMKKEARKILDWQTGISESELSDSKDNIAILEKSISDFYSGSAPAVTNTIELKGYGNISTNMVGEMERVLEYFQEVQGSTEGRLNGIKRLEEYHTSQNKALEAYHKAGGDLEGLSSSAEKIRLPGNYDESWQPGWPRK
jgi:hypothetical protein